MKKLIFALCVCAGLCACSSDDDLVSSTSTATQDGSVAYLTVNLKDVNSSTRATDGGFAYGTEAEQTVNNAYFYFYDDNGDYMAKGSLGSVSGTANTADNSDGKQDIEWQSNTIVAVYGLDDIKNLPTKMLTVLNKPSGVDLTNQSLDIALATLAGTPWGDTTNGFVMSTSVYDAGTTSTAGGPTGIVNYTPLTVDNFATEPVNIDADYTNGDAKAVDVYVERLAAKVTANVGTLTNATTGDDVYYNITDYVASEFINGAPTGGVYVKLLGFDVDCVARDAYISKNIQDDSQWSGLTFVWNGATNYRSYWAESPNYGVEVEYPTSSLGNTDADEDTTPLNEYLRYVSLAEPVTLGDATYCGENTNTTTVIGDATSSALTNLLVKGQVYTDSANTMVPLALVEYHGMYYTAEDFCNTVIDDVVEYDFTYVIEEAIDALKSDHPDLANELDSLSACIIKDNIWVIPAVEDHMPTGRNVNGNQEPQVFDGSFLSLYNDNDGNVNMFFNGAQPYWGSSANPDSIAVGSEIIAKYPESAIVYGGKDLDDYEFMFSLGQDNGYNLGALEDLGLIKAGVIFQINGEYYMILGNNCSFQTIAGHTYTLRNYLLRALTEEFDGIDSKIGSHKPNLFADGMMYYNVPIEHLGTTNNDGSIGEGQYGIVRNHQYNVTITSLENFGRGIADEDEVIVPLPEVTYYYLGTDIDILSWKHITQGVEW